MLLISCVSLIRGQNSAEETEASSIRDEEQEHVREEIEKDDQQEMMQLLTAQRGYATFDNMV